MAKTIQQKINVILDALILVFSEPRYSFIAFISATIMAITYPLLFPIAAGAKKISLLAFRGSLLDIAVLVSISSLFGIILAMQFYKFTRISRDYKKAGANLASTIVGIITSKACCLLPLILLAMGATAGISFFIKYTTELRLAGLFILCLSLYIASLGIVNNKCCVLSKTDGHKHRGML
ncbi:hypothetical protein HYX00_01555 [Candidatus Woesearchaeota archaeon]|nr:hypothetical protein [Candidatus Woesearchaeota archaeon]